MKNRKPILFALALAVVSVSALALVDGKFRLNYPGATKSLCQAMNNQTYRLGLPGTGCQADVKLTGCEKTGPNECTCDGEVKLQIGSCGGVGSGDGVWHIFE